MKKEERIARYGEAAYGKRLEQARARYNANREKVLEQQRERQRKEAFIARHGEEAWEKRAEKKQDWNKVHAEEANARSKKWAIENPEKAKARNHEGSRKGGKYYDKMLEDQRTGLRGERNKIRSIHRYRWSPYKQIIAPDSQIHHEWIPDTSEYRGVALVEAKPHQYGIVDVIEILDSKITLLTEDEIKERGRKKDEK